MTDAVNHPSHYQQYSHEVIALTSLLTFCEGNAYKYLLRSPFKGREVEDLQKALWYLEWIDKHQAPALRPLKRKWYGLALDFERDLNGMGHPELAEIVACVRKYWYRQAIILLRVLIKRKSNETV